MAQRASVALAVALMAIPMLAQSQQSYDDYVRDIEAQWDAYDQQREFEEFQREQDAAFQQFQQDQDDAFQRFRDDIQAKWNEFLEPTPEQWVDYDEEGDTRITVNFEETVEEDDDRGQIKVETLVEVDAVDGPQIPEEAIQQIG